MWAGWKYSGSLLMRVLIMGIGAGTAVSSYAAYSTVKKAEKQSS